MVGLADTLNKHDICVLSVDSTKLACSAVESGKGKGVDGSLDCSTESKGKTVKGVNACKANDNNPESFDVDFMGDVYSTGCDPEDAQCSKETASKILGVRVN